MSKTVSSRSGSEHRPDLNTYMLRTGGLKLRLLADEFKERSGSNGLFEGYPGPTNFEVCFQIGRRAAV